jgi:hypothetical protein
MYIFLIPVILRFLIKLEYFIQVKTSTHPLSPQPTFKYVFIMYMFLISVKLLSCMYWTAMHVTARIGVLIRAVLVSLMLLSTRKDVRHPYDLYPSLLQVPTCL